MLMAPPCYRRTQSGPARLRTGGNILVARAPRKSVLKRFPLELRLDPRLAGTRYRSLPRWRQAFARPDCIVTHHAILLNTDAMSVPLIFEKHANSG